MQPQIALSQLQSQYPDQVVALNKEQTRVLGHAKTFSQLIEQLRKQQINPQDCVYVGPISKPGTVSA